MQRLSVMRLKVMQRLSLPNSHLFKVTDTVIDFVCDYRVSSTNYCWKLRVQFPVAGNANEHNRAVSITNIQSNKNHTQTTDKNNILLGYTSYQYKMHQHVSD